MTYFALGLLGLAGVWYWVYRLHRAEKRAAYGWLGIKRRSFWQYLKDLR